MRLLGTPEIASADILHDLSRLVLFAVVLPIIGVVSFRATERRSRQTGSLGQF
jgi:hypothetical protein